MILVKRRINAANGARTHHGGACALAELHVGHVNERLRDRAGRPPAIDRLCHLFCPVIYVLQKVDENDFMTSVRSSAGIAVARLRRDRHGSALVGVDGGRPANRSEGGGTDGTGG
jgi:hypothetical protein